METMNHVVRNPGGFDSLDNYFGETNFPGMYVLLTKTRDADILTRSNWEVALEMLGGEKEGEVEIYHFGHWAVGWWEALCVKEGTRAYEVAANIEERLADYPALDEEHFFEMEFAEYGELWENCYDLDYKVELCKEAGLSIFAARREEIPLEVVPYCREY